MGLKTILITFWVTLTWLAMYWTGAAWAPMTGGYAVNKWVGADWRMCPLNQWGACRTTVPVGSIVLWSLMPPDDDTCWVYDQPTAQGPANMGAEENVQTPLVRSVRFWGDCKP